MRSEIVKTVDTLFLENCRAAHFKPAIHSAIFTRLENAGFQAEDGHLGDVQQLIDERLEKIAQAIEQIKA